jgi:hypothetical protein
MACKKEGCTDPAATNYDSKAENDDGNCIYDTNNPGGGSGGGTTGPNGEALPIHLSGTETTGRTIKDISTNGSVVEYYIDGHWVVDAPIIIEPGVRIEMRPGGRITIAANGSIDATGTANNKINIVGAQDEPGYWGYIYIKSNNLNNKLIHCNIANGSRDTFIYGTITLAGSAQLKMQNTSVVNGSEHGLYLEKGSSKLPGFTSNYFDKFTKSPLVLGGLYQTKFLDGSTTFGNNVTVERIYINGSNVLQDLTVPKVSYPYFMNEDFRIEAGHTDIDPGVEMIMGAAVKVSVESLASMAFNGTSTDKNIVRGDQPVQDFWGNIIINSNNPNNDFSWTDFSDAGGHWQTAATIYLRGNGRLQMDNCSIKNGAEVALDGSNNSTFIDNGGNSQSGNIGGGGILP